MMERLENVARDINGTLHGDRQAVALYVDIDTRRMEAPGGIFAALPGTNTDGHTFLPTVAKLGAVAALVSRLWFENTDASHRPSLNYLVVEDVERALWKLALAVRSRFGGRVIGTTGSVAKSTVKNMIQAVCEAGLGAGRSTPGNWNNLLGVPLTILGITPLDQFLNVEMGSNAHGEIPMLASLVQPEIAVITAVKAAHLEGFGTLEGVLKEKASLGHAVGSRGVVVIPSGDAMLRAEMKQFAGKVMTVGVNADDDIQIVEMRDEIRVSGVFEHRGVRTEIQLGMPGLFNLHNAALAFGVGTLLGVAPQIIAQGLANTRMPALRMELREIQQRTMILDCYNASPASMKSALDVLVKLSHGRGVAMLGAMYELGADSDTLHQEVARYALARNLTVVTVGEDARAYKDERSKSLHHVANHEAAAQWLTKNTTPGSVVLLKGSRKAAMEIVAQRYLEGVN